MRIEAADLATAAKVTESSVLYKYSDDDAPGLRGVCVTPDGVLLILPPPLSTVGYSEHCSQGSAAAHVRRKGTRSALLRQCREGVTE